jgi:hypothetical protein
VIEVWSARSWRRHRQGDRSLKPIVRCQSMSTAFAAAGFHSAEHPIYLVRHGEPLAKIDHGRVSGTGRAYGLPV